jgi:lipid-binding SYLF domain-containing protein
MHRLAFAAAAALGSALAGGGAITSSQAAMLATAARIAQDVRADAPPDSWDRARCVVVVPDVRKPVGTAAGEAGKGIMSCRAGDGWSAPAFIQFARGRWPFPAGAEQVDIVLLVMNESGVQKLLGDKVELGTDTTVAPGPVGRDPAASASTLNAEVLSYVRARGLFTGAAVSGGVLQPDASANRDVYGEDAGLRTILAKRSLSAPTQATAFLNALGAQPSTLPPASPVAVTPSAPPSGAAGASPAPAPAGGAATPDADLRARIVALQQAIDRLVIDAESSPVGTAGAAPRAGGPDMVVVSRERLMQLRRQLDAILALIDKR